MDIKNFGILRGEDIKIEKGHISIPVPKDTQSSSDGSKQERSFCEIRSDVLFNNGIIEFKFKSSSYDMGILLIFNTPDDIGAAIGLSRSHDSFLIGKGKRKIEPLIKVGNFKNYNLNQEHSLKFEIRGSEAKLYMNNVMLCEAPMSINESPIQLRFNSLGSLEIYDIKTHIVKPKIFVVMQFSKDYNELFEDVIKPVSESAGYECIRADEFYTSTPILKDIIESIRESTAIIAEITPDNPNVFYEIGYSHAINKPTILLCDKKRDKLPFDLSSFRTLFYENSIAGKRKVENSLKKYLEKIR
jgi:hypothetical protein